MCVLPLKFEIHYFVKHLLIIYSNKNGTVKCIMMSHLTLLLVTYYKWNSNDLRVARVLQGTPRLCLLLLLLLLITIKKPIKAQNAGQFNALTGYVIE
jgi:hypothetical protein